jgi:hypothetical protein
MFKQHALKEADLLAFDVDLEALMDPILVREYRARWQAVSEVGEAEKRRATLEERWARLKVGDAESASGSVEAPGDDRA